MQAFIYYLFYPLIMMIAHLPFWVLYIISDFLYIIFFNIARYRKRIVLENLRAVFPNKSEREILLLCKKYYRFLCDLIVETAKTIGWREKDVLYRVKFSNIALFEKFYKKNKSLILVLGHYGNWEWAGPCFSLHNKHLLNVIYSPFSNPYFEKMFAKVRRKFNVKITPKKNAFKEIITDKNKLTATALVADQSPAPITSAHWMSFLNQETAVFKGPAKIAKKMDYPVIYMHIHRVKRGFYEVTGHIICENPKSMSEVDITESFNRKLEEDILAQPETWLWSHKRWKHKKEYIKKIKW